MRLIRSLWHRRRGQSLVEFAIAIPVAVFLLLSVVEVGRHFYTRATVRNAVQEAARFAITGQTLTDPATGTPLSRAESIKQVLVDRAVQLNIPVSDIVLDPSNGGGPDELVRISLTYLYQFGGGMLPSFMPTTMPITVSTTVKNEPIF
ncbi:MAG: pilus assembly protein [Gemmatimonadota bacterium]